MTTKRNIIDFTRAKIKDLVMSNMYIKFSPSKLSWIIFKLLNEIPYYRHIRDRKQIEKLYELAKRVATLNFSIRVLDSGWATQHCLTDENYRNLTLELLEIDKMLGTLIKDSVYQSLHWSRRYEYPYALMKLQLPAQPLKEFKILDCGAGVSPIQFYLAMKGYEYYSLDLDLDSLIRVARFKSKKELKTLYLNYGNILDLPFPNDYFDRVINISVLEHILYPLGQNTDIILKGFVNELLRVLKPKGLAILTFDVNMNIQKSQFRLYFYEYESLCKILGISPTQLPQHRLYSSDTEEGKMMGEALCTYCVTFTRDKA